MQNMQSISQPISHQKPPLGSQRPPIPILHSHTSLRINPTHIQISTNHYSPFIKRVSSIIFKRHPAPHLIIQMNPQLPQQVSDFFKLIFSDLKRTSKLPILDILKLSQLVVTTPHNDIIPILDQQISKIILSACQSTTLNDQPIDKQCEIIETLYRFINGQLPDKILKTDIAHVEKVIQGQCFRKFQKKEVVNGEMLKLASMAGSTRRSMGKKGRMLAVKIAESLLKVIDLNRNYESYDETSIEKVVLLVVSLFKSKTDAYCLAAVRIHQHLSFLFEKNTAIKYIFQFYNTELSKNLSSIKNPEQRMSVIGMIEINKSTLKSILKRVKDQHKPIRAAVVQKLVNDNISLQIFRPHIFYKFMEECLSQTQDSKVIALLTQMVHKQEFSGKWKRCYGVYEKLLCFMDQDVLLYFPALAESFEKFLYHYIRNETRMNELKNYLSKCLTSLSSKKPSIEGAFYLRFAIVCLQGTSYNEIYQTVRKHIINEKIPYQKLLQSSFTSQTFFDIVQLFQLITRLQPELYDSAKQDIAKFIFSYLVGDRFCAAEFPAHIIKYKTKQLKYATYQEYQQNEFILPLGEKEPLTKCVHLIPLFLRLLRRFRSRIIDDNLGGVNEAMVELISEGKEELIALEQKTKKKNQPNKQETQRIAELRQQQSKLYEKYSRFVIAYFQEYEVADNGLYEYARKLLGKFGMIEPKNQMLRIFQVVLESKYIINLLRARDEERSVRFREFMRGFGVAAKHPEKNASLLKVYLKETTQILLVRRAERDWEREQERGSSNSSNRDQDHSQTPSPPPCNLNALLHFEGPHEDILKNTIFDLLGSGTKSERVFATQITCCLFQSKSLQTVSEQLGFLILRSFSVPVGEQIRFQRMFQHFFTSSIHNDDDRMKFIRGIAAAIQLVMGMERENYCLKPVFLDLKGAEKSFVFNLVGFFMHFVELLPATLGDEYQKELFRHMLHIVDFAYNEDIDPYIQQILTYSATASEGDRLILWEILLRKRLPSLECIINEHTNERNERNNLLNQERDQIQDLWYQTSEILLIQVIRRVITASQYLMIKLREFDLITSPKELKRRRKRDLKQGKQKNFLKPKFKPHVGTEKVQKEAPSRYFSEEMQNQILYDSGSESSSNSSDSDSSDSDGESNRILKMVSRQEKNAINKMLYPEKRLNTIMQKGEAQGGK